MVCFPHSNSTRSCDDGWVYDRSMYENTVVYDFDLVCDYDWMKDLSKSMVGVGQLVGALLLGQLADIYGRKLVFFFSLIALIVVGVSTAFSPWFPMFVVGQFLMATCGTGVYLTGFVLGVELVGSEYRTFCSMHLQMAFSIGYVGMAGVAYALNGNWRHIQFIVGVVYVLFIPYYWLLPESVRWLIQKARFNDAEKILQKAARINKVALPEDLFESEKSEAQNSANIQNHVQIKESVHRPTMLDLFKTPNLRARTLNLCYTWFTCSLVYYGIAFNTDALHENPYLAFLISGAVEFPGVMSCWFFLSRVGRRWLLCLYLSLGGVALVISALLENETATAVLSMVAKFFVSGSFAVVYIFTAEMFPTCVRTAGLGITATLARIGTIIAPYIMLSTSVWNPLPFMLMGVTSFLAGVLVLLLPETRGQKIPETLAEGEIFGVKKKTYKVFTNSHDAVNSICGEEGEEDVTLNAPSV
ncbi:organic cation transporter protein-like isoform X2 [Glandiceps talaboti]